MRILKNIIGCLALAGLVAYTMSLPDHPITKFAQATVAAVATIPAATTTAATLIAAPTIAQSPQSTASPIPAEPEICRSSLHDERRSLIIVSARIPP